MKYKLAIFDSDGTLADTLPWMRSIFNELADTHGFRRIEADEYESVRDLHGRELLKRVGLPLWKVPQVVNDMRKRMAERKEPFLLFPGIPEVLQRLSKCGIQIGIVSSNSRANVENILGRDTAAYINHWNCGASMFGKANKIKAVIRASGVPHQQVIYIGDEVRDAEAAQKAGIAFGAVAWGQHRPATLQGLEPDEFFGTVAEIADNLCGTPVS